MRTVPSFKLRTATVTLLTFPQLFGPFRPRTYHAPLPRGSTPLGRELHRQGPQPAPDQPAYAEVGTAVKKGQVLCIIEAMKLMNEIDSEYDGEVTNIYVENGQAVQYGERLFAIKLKS